MQGTNDTITNKATDNGSKEKENKRTRCENGYQIYVHKTVRNAKKAITFNTLENAYECILT